MFTWMFCFGHLLPPLYNVWLLSVQLLFTAFHLSSVLCLTFCIIFTSEPFTPLSYPPIPCFLSLWSPVSQLLPACSQIFNLFYPSDPSASRLEPLLQPYFHKLPPFAVPRYQRYPLGDGRSSLIGRKGDSASEINSRAWGREGELNCGCSWMFHWLICFLAFHTAMLITFRGFHFTEGLKHLRNPVRGVRSGQPRSNYQVMGILTDTYVQ